MSTIYPSLTNLSISIAKFKVKSAIPPFFSKCCNSNYHSSFSGQSLNFKENRFTITSKRSSSSCQPFKTRASMAPLEIIVKAATGNPSVLGDCPFCHRVLLTLEEKKIPYEKKLVDLSDKPSWFLEINPDGKVPVILHEGKWIPDSDVIVEILEKEHPHPSLKAPEEILSVGSKIFPSFVKFLKSTDPNDETEKNLVHELNLLDDHLKTKGPFVNGEYVTSVDLALAPKLYHLRIALKHFKGWTIPQNLTHVLGYIKAIEERESFVKTLASEEYVVNGWKRHLA